MGTQQILLIVLSVIIVGVAIAVGITMFRNQAYNSNQQAVAGELNNYGAQVLQWWKTPASQGGAGQTMPATGGETAIKTFIGMPVSNEKTETGYYNIDADPTATAVVLKGIGLEKKGTTYPKVTATVNCETGAISASVGTATSATAW